MKNNQSPSKDSAFNQKNIAGSPNPPDSSDRDFYKSTKGEIDTFVPEKKFGTFHGVYRPTILTILGVMMYIREGWLVGNAGLLGAILVICLAFLITGTTALSISTIVSNIRIGRGGVFSLVSQSLGLEVGGSIGVPLFLALAFSAPMYLFGFVEGWSYLFPEHSTRTVLLTAFFTAGALSFFGAKLSFRVQLLIMLGVIFALVSIFGGFFTQPVLHTPTLWGNFEDGNIWYLFSVYFPAATGIMVGSSMSGNLKDPRKSIPRGTILAWLTALLVYVSLAIWYSLIETPEGLRTNALVSVSNSWMPNAVLIGILSSCFSAAISSMVTAPRILQALAEYDILPFSKIFKKLHSGEPRIASMFTSVMIFFPLILFDGLDTIAPFVTQFFISIYLVINSVLAIEQRLNLLSFRPLIHPPKILPLIGSFACLTAMLIVSPVVGLFSIVFILSIYAYLSRKKLLAPWETVQSGLFISLAEWSTRKAILSGQQYSRRVWKPNLIIPITKISQWMSMKEIFHSIVDPQGSLHVIVISPKKKEQEQLEKQLKIDAIKSNSKGVFTRFSTLPPVTPFNYVDVLKTVISVTRGSFLSPNSLFLSLKSLTEDEVNKIEEITRETQKALIYSIGWQEKTRCKKITLWVRDQSPNWELSLNLSNLNYATLLAYQLKKNNHAKLSLRCVVNDEKNAEMAQSFLSELTQSARLGEGVNVNVLTGRFADHLKSGSQDDINIFGLAKQVKKSELLKIHRRCKTACLFVRDSGTGRESALA